jgi:hypothetical protein
MLLRVLIAALVALVPVRVGAVCIHDGKLYAKTTFAQEFKQSRWVVRARVLSARDHWPNEGTAWTLYNLRLLSSFKGVLPPHFTFYTRRDSGGFYMDIPWKGHDIGGEYLLFLNPWVVEAEDPRVARGATWVNYECGQSRPWREVSKKERRELRELSRASRH